MTVTKSTETQWAHKHQVRARLRACVCIGWHDGKHFIKTNKTHAVYTHCCRTQDQHQGSSNNTITQKEKGKLQCQRYHIQSKLWKGITTTTIITINHSFSSIYKIIFLRTELNFATWMNENLYGQILLLCTLIQWTYSRIVVKSATPY